MDDCRVKIEHTRELTVECDRGCGKREQFIGDDRWKRAVEAGWDIQKPMAFCRDCRSH